MPAGVLRSIREFIRIFNGTAVPISRDIPHQQLVTLFDILTSQYRILRGGSSHIGQRCLVTDDFRHHIGYQPWVIPQLLVFSRVVIQEFNTAGD